MHSSTVKFIHWKDRAVLTLRLRKLVLQYPSAFAECFVAGYESAKEDQSAIANQVATDIAKFMAGGDFDQVLVRKGKGGRLEVIAFVPKDDEKP